MAHGAADGVARVKMQREIRTGVAALGPAIDLFVICAEDCGDGFFGGREVRPRRSSGDVAFAIEAFAKLVVGAADVLVECVAAAVFVATEVVAIA